MKVAFLGHLGEVSGAGIALLQWAVLCRNHGWESCAALPEGPIHERAEKLGVKAEVYPLARGNLIGTNPIQYFRNARRAKQFVTRWLESEQPDWVIVHSGANVVAASAIRASGVKCMWHIHEESRERGFLGVQRRIKRWAILRTAHRLAFASASGLRDFAAPLTYPQTVLKNPVENLKHLLSQSKTPVSPPQILFNGTSERKGLDLFLAALAVLQREHPDLPWQAVILGHIDESLDYHRGKILKQAATLKDRVRFAGMVSSDAMADYYRTSQLAVSASRQESLPIFLVEAMAAGVPVIATETGDCARLLGQGRFGTLVGDGDRTTSDDKFDLSVPTQLVPALINALSENDSRAKAAREMIVSEYDPTQIFEELRVQLT